MQDYSARSNIIVPDEEDFNSFQGGNAQSYFDDDIQFDMETTSSPIPDSISNSYENPSPSDNLANITTRNRLGRFSNNQDEEEEEVSSDDEEGANQERSDLPFAYQQFPRQKPAFSSSNSSGFSLVSSMKNPAAHHPNHPSMSYKTVSFADGNAANQPHLGSSSISANESALSTSMKHYNAIKMKYMKTLNIPVPNSNIENGNNPSSPTNPRRSRTISAPVSVLAKSMPLAVPSNTSEGRDWKMAKSVYGEEFIPPHELVKHDTFSVWQYEQRKHAANKAV